jgi:hypothetical protein
MKNKLTLVLSLLSGLACAGGNHFHAKQVAKCPASKCTVEQITSAVPAAVEHMIHEKQMEAFWKDAKVESVSPEPKTFTKGGKTMSAWVVALSSENKEASAKPRYIFITTDGLVFRTNLTGVL